MLELATPSFRDPDPVFLGWLRGEKRHCSMAAIPTIEDEDAKRPSREHEKPVGDRTRIVNRMKAMLARFGIRTFKPTFAQGRASKQRLDGLQEAPLPENTRAELRRDMMRLRVIREQRSRKPSRSACASSRRRLPRRKVRL